MITDYNPYYIMDAALESRVSEYLRLAVEMAKSSHPHLVERYERAIEMYERDLLTFTGTQNKPMCKPAYKKGGTQ